MAAVCVAIFCLGQKGTRKKYFFTLVIDWNGFGEIIIRWKRWKK